jgi:hypothetical protein
MCRRTKEKGNEKEDENETEQGIRNKGVRKEYETI